MQVFLPCEMPRSFLVKRGGLSSHRPPARIRSPEPAPTAFNRAGDVTLSWDATSRRDVQAAGRSDGAQSGTSNLTVTVVQSLGPNLILSSRSGCLSAEAHFSVGSTFLPLKREADRLGPRLTSPCTNKLSVGNFLPPLHVSGELRSRGSSKIRAPSPGCPVFGQVRKPPPDYSPPDTLPRL